MQQLGKTPFFRKEKPSPYDEADRLTWYLTHVFYPAVGNMLDTIAQNYPDAVDKNAQLIQLGFIDGCQTLALWQLGLAPRRSEPRGVVAGSVDQGRCLSYRLPCRLRHPPSRAKARLQESNVDGSGTVNSKARSTPYSGTTHIPLS